MSLNFEIIYFASHLLPSHSSQSALAEPILFSKNEYVWRTVKDTQTAFKRSGYTKQLIMWNSQLIQENYIISLYFCLSHWFYDLMFSLSYFFILFLFYRFYAMPGSTEFCEALREYSEITLASEIRISQKIYFLSKSLRNWEFIPKAMKSSHNFCNWHFLWVVESWPFISEQEQ